MMQDSTFRFQTSISLEGYQKKSDATACLSKAGADAIGMNKMAFYPRSVTVDEFLQYATTGHAFCNIFAFDVNQKYWVTTSTGKHYESYPVYRNGPNKGAMKLSFKSDQFFYGSQAVYVDVDYTRYANVRDYLRTLTYPPTCVYMSYSDGADKGGVVSRRFRMVYVLDQIYGRDEFIRISTAITDQIVLDTAEPMEDDCGKRPSQYMNGVYGNNETYTSYFIYTATDFPQSYDQPSPPQSQGNAGDEDAVVFDEELVREMETMDYDRFMHFHSWQYRYVYRTERPGEWNGIYQLTDEYFLELWYPKERQVDGMHRRRQLFMRACLRRLMYPDIDANTLLFNLYVDRKRFFDNSDGALSINALMTRVKRAMGLTPEQLVAFCSNDIRRCQRTRPKFIVQSGIRTDWGTLSGISKRIRWAELDREYDRSKSVTENAENLDVSLATLYRYCHENFIDTNPERTQMTAREKREAKRLEKARNIERFKDIYDRSLSRRENLVLLEKAGLKMSIGTLQEWIDKYIEPSTEPTSTATLEAIFGGSSQIVFPAPPDFSHWQPTVTGFYDTPVSDWDTPAAKEETNKFQWFREEESPFQNWQPDFSRYYPV